METKPPSQSPNAPFDYSFVDTVGNIAIYDDLLSGPRVVKVQPADTATYIESLASGIYEYSREAGGSIPYTVIREVSENFIHAQFKEVLVTIRDQGNTISFADHGPGIPSKEKAQMPGFSSAVEPMRNYIRGVGSGLPIVREYLESSHGTITIEDNLGTGAVVTISLARGADEELEEPFDESGLGRQDPFQAPIQAPMTPYGVPQAGVAIPEASGSVFPAQTVVPAYPYSAPVTCPPTSPYPAAGNPYGTAAAQPYPQATYPPTAGQPYGAAPYPAPYPPYGSAPAYGQAPPMPAPALNEKERLYLKMLASEGPLGPTEMAKLTDGKPNTVFYAFERLEQAGLIQKMGKQRSLTPYGQQVAQNL